MEEEKKKIDRILEFSELFMSIYAINNALDNGELYFSKNIREHLENVFCHSGGSLLSKLNLLELDESEIVKNVNLDTFLTFFEKTKSKKYFADEFNYDLIKDQIKTKVDINNAVRIRDSFAEEDINIVESIVNEFEMYQMEEENEKFSDNNVRKYIQLKLNKATTECGNSNSD